MKRPPFSDHVSGNPLVFLFLAGCAILFGYMAWDGSAPWEVELGILLMLAASWNAAERVRAFKRKQREWDEAAGIEPRRNPFAGLVPVLRLILGGALWVALGAGFYVATRASGFTWPVICVWVAVISLFAVWLFKLVKRHAVPLRNPRDKAVTVCLAKPLSSPQLSDAYAAVPAYCLSQTTSDRMKQ